MAAFDGREHGVVGLFGWAGTSALIDRRSLRRAVARRALTVHEGFNRIGARTVKAVENAPMTFGRSVERPIIVAEPLARTRDAGGAVSVPVAGLPTAAARASDARTVKGATRRIAPINGARVTVVFRGDRRGCSAVTGRIAFLVHRTRV